MSPDNSGPEKPTDGSTAAEYRLHLDALDEMPVEVELTPEFVESVRTIYELGQQGAPTDHASRRLLFEEFLEEVALDHVEISFALPARAPA